MYFVSHLAGGLQRDWENGRSVGKFLLKQEFNYYTKDAIN